MLPGKIPDRLEPGLVFLVRLDVGIVPKAGEIYIFSRQRPVRMAQAGGAADMEKQSGHYG
jgi:hypothetical protein